MFVKFNNRIDNVLENDNLNVYSNEGEENNSEEGIIQDHVSEEKNNLIRSFMHFWARQLKGGDNYSNYFCGNSINSFNSNQYYSTSPYPNSTTNSFISDTISSKNSLNFQSYSSSANSPNNNQNELAKYQSAINYHTQFFNPQCNIQTDLPIFNRLYMQSFLKIEMDYKLQQQNAQQLQSNLITSSNLPPQTTNFDNFKQLNVTTDSLSSSYSMHNLLKNTNDLKKDDNLNDKTIKNKNELPINSFNQQEQLKFNSSFTPNLTKSNNIYDLLNTNSTNSKLSNNKIEQNHLIPSNELFNKDLSKENHFNYSNVNNHQSLINHQSLEQHQQQIQQQLNQKSSNSPINHSIASLVDSNQSSFLPYSPIVNSNFMTKTSTIKKEQQNLSTFNNKLFSSSSAFTTNPNQQQFNLNNNLATELLTTNALSSNNLNISSNSAFSPNSMISSPHSSSSANSAASAFSLTEQCTHRSITSLYNSNHQKHQQSNNDRINTLNNLSTRSSTPVVIKNLKSSLNTDSTFNLQFTNLNAPINQCFSQRFNSNLDEFNKFNNYLENDNRSKFLNSFNNSSHYQQSNLNTSSSLGSLNNSLNDSSIDDQLSNSINNNNLNGTHIKKPLNAFMLFMQEKRKEVQAGSTLKESAQINAKLGTMWRNLSPKEQEHYFQESKKLREQHLKKHPNWSAKDNYAINARKKKKKKDKSSQMRQFKEYTNSGALKKCRARYGVKEKDKWCKPCLRKKKCEKYKDDHQLNIDKH